MNDDVLYYRFLQHARKRDESDRETFNPNAGRTRLGIARQSHFRSTIVLGRAGCAGLTDRRLRRSLAGYSVQPRASRRGWILTPVAGCWNARRVTLSSLAHNYTRLLRHACDRVTSLSSARCRSSISLIQESPEMETKAHA